MEGAATIGQAGVVEMTDADITVAEILAEMLDEARLVCGSGAAENWAAREALGRRFPVPLYVLLERDGDAFLTHAYQELLGRRPAEAELERYRAPLAEASLAKIEILGEIRFGAEGETMGRSVPGLRDRYRLQRLGRLPLIGRALRVMTSIVLLPRAIRDIQRLEQATNADRLRLEEMERSAIAAGPGLAARVGQLEARLAGVERMERRLGELEQKATQD